MKPKSPVNVSINPHEGTSTQIVSLPIQSCPSNLTNNNSSLHWVRIKNPWRIIIGQININSIRNQFEELIYIVNNEIDILMLSETKLDNTLPTSQFFMQGCSISFRTDWTLKGGILGTSKKISLGKKLHWHWYLLWTIFNSNKLKKKSGYEVVLIIDIKTTLVPQVTLAEHEINWVQVMMIILYFLGSNNVKVSEHIQSKKSCLSKHLFQKTQELLCVLIWFLKNCLWSFQNTADFETGLSDFHKFTFTVLKQYYPKQKQKVVFHWKYKHFCNDLFRSETENELSNYDINDKEYDIFKEHSLRS